MKILHVKEAQGTVETVGKRLEEAVKARQFGVIAVIDLQSKMIEKGIPFERACRVYEVCSPVQAKRVLEENMGIATALPCRIAVYEEDGRVRLGTMLPTEILGLFAVPELAPVAREVETAIKAMMDDAAGTPA